jgi:predicted transcriptional regulator
MKNNSLQIRLSDKRKHKLMQYAAEKDRTITGLIEEWIDSLVLEKERETAG